MTPPTPAPRLRGARGPLLAALGLVALALGLRPAAGWLAPRLAVAAATQDVHGLMLAGETPGRSTWTFGRDDVDPWGHRLVGDGAPLRTLGDPMRSLRRYSVGPDGVDEAGGGDDVVPTARELLLARPIAAQPVAFVSLAILLLACTTSDPARRARSRALQVELVRAAGLAGCLLLFGPLASMAVLGVDLAPYREAIAEHLHVHVDPNLAMLGTYGLLCTSVALAWRLTRPFEEDGPGTPGGASAPG